MTKKLASFGALAFALGAFAAFGSAHAASVYSVGDLSISSSGMVDPSTVSDALVTGVPSSVTLIGDATAQTGQLANAWNPYSGSDTTHNWIALAVNNTSGAAVFSFAAPVNTLSLLWGSPSNDDAVNLYSGLNGQGTLVGTVTANDLYAAQTAATANFNTIGNDNGPGNIISIASPTAFQSALFSATQDAFEFADVSTVPLPKSLSLLVMALSSLAGLRFWKTRNPDLES